MEIDNLINENLICYNLEAESKRDFWLHWLTLPTKITNWIVVVLILRCDAFNGYVNSLLDREKHAPTAIGYSYGIKMQWGKGTPYCVCKFK